VYSERFPGEQELTRFLGIVFAFLQACEFLLLASLSRALLERTSPLLRNLVFPLTSLACLLYLAFSDRLMAAVITHVNAEALSNAIFQPVHNVNFLALPVSIQGRARTLSEGIFYPAGLAIAGGLLWSMGETGTTAAAEFVAILFTLSFIILNVGAGVLFLPTLIASVRSGVVPLADLSDRIVGLPAAAADRVQRFLRSARPELRRDGIALSRWLGPAQVADDLVALASSADLPTRRALVRLASDDSGSWVRTFVDAACGRDARSSVVAMQVMLARREMPSAEQAARPAPCTDPSALALARLLAGGSDPGAALPPLAPLLRHPEIAADVIEAVVGADRPDHAGILLAALPAAPAEQQRRALEFLRSVQARGIPSPWRGLGRFARHPEPRVRSEAMALLGGCRHRTALCLLTRGLADRSALVRGSAADALAAQGDDVVELLRTRLIPITIGSAEAASALSRMDTDRALIGSLQELRRAARGNARLLVRLAALPRTAPWLGLAACAHDHEARIVALALAALRASLQRHVFGHVRDALRSEDRRLRADASRSSPRCRASGPSPRPSRRCGSCCSRRPPASAARSGPNRSTDAPL
jgi:HEAT repeats